MRFSAHRESHSVPAAAYHTALDACAYVSKILLHPNDQRGGITRKITSQVAKTGHGVYHAYNLSAVSRAGQRAFEDLPSIIMHPPGDATFFSRDLITENQMRDIREEIGTLDDRPILSYHARISAMKGQAFLPQVIAQLKAIYSQPFSLVIVGPESESGALQVLNREIERFGVRDSVAVVGGRSQDFIRGLLGVSSVCVFPTFCEGLGLTAVEAQLMEVPVVAHKVGGVSDVVREGVTGRLIKPGDARGFAEAIAGLLDSPQLRSEYGSAGRQLMKRDFSPHGLAAYAMQRLYLPQLLNCGRAAL
jgi:glycosyltransferase involved in cell wall biosynthesis